MPYNPSSAYPRHSTYTPPVYDRGFARGFNEVPWGTRPANAPVFPGADVRHAIQAGMTPGTKEHIGTSMAAMGQSGFVTAGMMALNRSAQRAYQVRMGRKIWNRAEYGDDPNETAAESAPADEGPKLILTDRGKRELGGRAHSGGVNDRLGAMSQREETTTAMDEVVGRIFGGKSGGPMKIPLWRRGFSRG